MWGENWIYKRWKRENECQHVQKERCGKRRAERKKTTDEVILIHECYAEVRLYIRSILTVVPNSRQSILHLTEQTHPYIPK